MGPYAALFAVALVIGAVWYFERRIRRARAREETPEGFRGWLAFLAINQWLGVLGIPGALAYSTPEIARYWSYAALRSALLLQAAIVLAVWTFMIYVTVMMMKKRRIFPLLFRIQVGLAIALPVLLVLSQTASGIPIARLDLDAEVGRSIVPTIAQILWFAYSLKSLRVRNTFVH